MYGYLPNRSGENTVSNRRTFILMSKSVYEPSYDISFYHVRFGIYVLLEQPNISFGIILNGEIHLLTFPVNKTAS